MTTNVTNTIINIGANDHDVDLFEGQYIVPNGMAYNSYAIIDDKIAIMDTVDPRKTTEWLANVEQALASRKPQSVAFWQAYLLSLCGHLERLEREAEPEDKPQERQLLRGGIQTVQAVLYALQETERTENEPRETD